MPTAVESTFDVVAWFHDRALDDNEYLQPQKLHRLLYLAQAYYAVAHYGRKLMPATFVADEMGPVEPDVFRAFEASRPYIEPAPLPDSVSHFLDSIWRRFGAHSADHLSRHLRGHKPYLDALGRGPRAEIPLEDMRAFYGRARDPAKAAPGVRNVMRARVMRSQTGKPVAVSQWMPPALSRETSSQD